MHKTVRKFDEIFHFPVPKIAGLMFVTPAAVRKWFDSMTRPAAYHIRLMELYMILYKRGWYYEFFNDIQTGKEPFVHYELRKWRDLRGWSMTEAGRVCGVHCGTWRGWEYGNSVVSKGARRLFVCVEWLILKGQGHVLEGQKEITPVIPGAHPIYEQFVKTTMYSQAKIARELCTNPPTVWKWGQENNSTPSPQFIRLMLLILYVISVKLHPHFHKDTCVLSEPPHYDLKDWRKSKGWSMEKAAKTCGVAHITWQQWEYGKRYPSAGARKLFFSIDWLIEHRRLDEFLQYVELYQLCR